MFGNSLIGIAGLISLLGPIKEKGDARSEKIGSINIFSPSRFNRIVAWPTQTKLFSELVYSFQVSDMGIFPAS